MNTQIVFGVSVLLSFVAFGMVTKLYIWPSLRRMRREDALLPLVLFHTFRFVGLSFLIPGVVSPLLPASFAAPVAYGDLIATFFAITAAIALSRRFSYAVLLVWLFNVWGTADLLYAFYQGQFGVRVDPSALGAAFYIPTFLVPILLITHVLVFRILLRRDANGVPASFE